jgi:hypothetical protein
MISAPTRGSTVPRAHSQSYPSVQATASDPSENSWDFRPEILATIATSGPIELAAIRARPSLAHATAFGILESLKCLIRTGQVEAWPQSEPVETEDGIRTRRDFVLYCLCRGGGEP